MTATFDPRPRAHLPEFRYVVRWAGGHKVHYVRRFAAYHVRELAEAGVRAEVVEQWLDEDKLVYEDMP